MNKDYLEKPNQINISKLRKQLVYHYTSENSMLNILNTNSFWVTYSDDLDDPKEIIFIEDILSEIFKKNIFTRNIFLDKVYSSKDYISEAKNELPLIFVLSLSAEKNVKKLWTEYSHPDGCNLGFYYNDVARILKYYNDNCKSFAVMDGKVIYNYEMQINLIINEIKLANYYRLKHPHIEMFKIFQTLFTNLSMYNIFFKRSKYKDEQEYRIAFAIGRDEKTKVPVHPIKTRQKNYKQVKYIDVPFKCARGLYAGKMPLVRINKGPLNTFTDEYIKDILLSKNYNHITIGSIKKLNQNS